MSDLAIVIMAAGLGSRFGGNKQLVEVGPNGEVFFDFAITDAMAAGADRVVLIVRREFAHTVDEHVRKKNAQRGPRVTEELAVMRIIGVAKLPDYVEETVRVTARGTIRVRQCGYSVPSRLVGARLTVRIYEHRIEAYYVGVLELACARARNGAVRIDYRHIIWSLVRKPGAFARYVYREELFPAPIFRRAYDALHTGNTGDDIKSWSQTSTALDLAYLRILHLAASTMQSDVEAALALLFEAGQPITVEAVKALVHGATARGLASTEMTLTLPAVELTTYDALLTSEVAA